MKEGQKTLRVEGLDYVDDVELFSLWTINRNKNCQKTSPNLVKMARGDGAYWKRAVEVVIPCPAARTVGRLDNFTITKLRSLAIYLFFFTLRPLVLCLPLQRIP